MKTAKIPKSATPIFHVRALVMPQSNMLCLAAVLDPLRAANRAAGTQVYTWDIATATDVAVELTTGLTVPANPAAQLPPPDMLALIAGFDIESQSRPETLRQLMPAIHHAPLTCGIDGGGEILARCGVLRGHRATTHWEDLEKLELAFPEITVVRDRFVQSGKFITTGGASPCIDMMLHLIQRHHGRTLAESVMRTFLYDPVHAGSDPQSLVSVSRLKRRSPPVARALQLMEEHLEEPIPVSEIARLCGLSVRRLEMLFVAETGSGPGQTFRALRLAEARRLVVDTPDPLQNIAVRCGFNSLPAFSRAFKDAFGTAPSHLRKR
ncbi:GlxA family transcriptional regulator [Neptunicoccus cionae]|uniref:AraC family transcriptional regulator n=1 Tax=Neptunicoccus cionae TaxID=2035344 RepID=A0A916VR54_9RHOB|nr:GlxA family transcriptional regulator [Amylibacter cionae]GGA23405.1 AraC family transcriptional regulator [Amylibacter cionae]